MLNSAQRRKYKVTFLNPGVTWQKKAKAVHELFAGSGEDQVVLAKYLGVVPSVVSVNLKLFTALRFGTVPGLRRAQSQRAAYQKVLAAEKAAIAEVYSGEGE